MYKPQNFEMRPNINHTILVFTAEDSSKDWQRKTSTIFEMLGISSLVDSVGPLDFIPSKTSTDSSYIRVHQYFYYQLQNMQ